MSLTIIMPDGAKFDERNENMDAIGATELAAYTSQMMIGSGMQPPRTVTTVAAELEAAIAAASRVKALRDELDGLLGKKRRGPRKDK